MGPSRRALMRAPGRTMAEVNVGAMALLSRAVSVHRKPITPAELSPITPAELDSITLAELSPDQIARAVTPQGPQEDSEAFVAAHLECDAVADCTLLMPGCPLGCHVAVATASAAEAEQLASTLRTGCTYMCPEVPALVCQDRRCATVDRGSACVSDTDCGWGEIDHELHEPSDCICLGCPFVALNLSTIRRRRAIHDELCGAGVDGDGNPCGVGGCAMLPMARCVEGQCAGAP